LCMPNASRRASKLRCAVHRHMSCTGAARGSVKSARPLSTYPARA
jgi:hypothetical protein